MIFHIFRIRFLPDGVEPSEEAPVTVTTVADDPDYDPNLVTRFVVLSLDSKDHDLAFSTLKSKCNLKDSDIISHEGWVSPDGSEFRDLLCAMFSEWCGHQLNKVFDPTGDIAS